MTKKVQTSLELQSVECTSEKLLELQRGNIPSPEVFDQFDPDTKRALLNLIHRGVKVQFDDESDRQNLLTEAEIKESLRG